jgi:hypothetical protein
MGYPGASLAPKSPRAKRTAIALIVVMVILIAMPLGVNGREVAIDTTAESRAAEATRDWLEGTGYQYVSAQARDGIVTIIVKGQGDLPLQQRLEDSLVGRLYDMKVRVSVVPTQDLEFHTAAGAADGN